MHFLSENTILKKSVLMKTIDILLEQRQSFPPVVLVDIFNYW